MKLEKALKEYRKALNNGDMHAYLVNSCYDRCRHCYVGTVSENSSRAKHIDTDNFLHFVGLMKQDNDNKINVALSGGDPLLHPEIVKILDYLSPISNLEILTSGFALSVRNTRNRREILEALDKSKASFMIASPNEPYHSITWQDVKEIKRYIEEQGFNPNKFGYPSRSSDIVQKVLARTLPPGWIGYLIDKFSKGNKMPRVIAIGRAKNLPEEQHLKGNRECDIFSNPNQIYLNYNGNLQYCLYTCHDGFMNINELRGINNKQEAIGIVLDRLSRDPTFQDIIKLDTCYFADEIRKKSEVEEVRDKEVNILEEGR
mgnify:CR=1 FL=1